MASSDKKVRLKSVEYAQIALGLTALASENRLDDSLELYKTMDENERANVLLTLCQIASTFASQIVEYRGSDTPPNEWLRKCGEDMLESAWRDDDDEEEDDD